MKNKTFKTIFASLVLVLVILGTCQIAKAEEAIKEQTLPTSSLYLWVKTKEFVQLNLFTWKKSSKTELLADFTDQRIDEMNYAQSIDDTDAVDLALSRYQWQKTKELQYTQNVNDDAIMTQIKERTLEQQREMTKLQLNLENNDNLQQNMVEVQKNVANQIKETVNVVEGEEGAAQVELQTRYIWIDPNADANGNLPPLPDNAENWEYAPGTSGRDTTGKVVEIQITIDSEANSVKIDGQNSVKVEGSNDGSSTTVETNSNGNSVRVETNQGSGDSGNSQNVIINEEE